MKNSLIYTLTVLGFGLAGVHADIREDFSSYTVGHDLTTPLDGGMNWSGDWTGTVTATVSDSAELDSGGRYLSYTATGSATTSLTRNMLTTDVDFGENHTFTFDWRPDALDSSFNNTSDRYEFYNEDLSTGENGSFLFGIFGASRGANSTGGVFAAYDRGTDPVETFSGDRYFDLLDGSLQPLTVVAGTTYHITVDVRPGVSEWDLFISDGITTVFRTGMTTWGAGNSEEGFGLNLRGNTGSDTRTASLDSIAIVPEPGTMLLMGIAFCTLVLFRCRKVTFKP